VAGCLEMARGLKFKKKKAAAFGCYGWSGESVKMINELLEKAGFVLINEGLKVQWNPDNNQQAEAIEFGKAIAKA